MFRLKQFELQVNPTILNRGRDYYENNAVSDLEEIDNGSWHAIVNGSEQYSIEIEISERKKITSYSCDCPFDGDICKHIVAVLFLIREQLADTSAVSPATSKSNFNKLLDKITLKEYQEFVLAHAAKDKKFKSYFERYFANKDPHINIDQQYTKQLKRLIGSISGNDFIDYKSLPRLMNEVNELLGEGQVLLEKEFFGQAFILARSVLTEIIELITYCDDSSGYIGDMIWRTIELLKSIEANEKVPVALWEELLFFIQSATSNPWYFDYGDFGYDMTEIYHSLAIKLSKEKVYLEYIDTQLKKTSKEAYSYKKDFFLVRKINFLQATGKPEAQQLIRQHLDVLEIRRGEVNKLIDDNKLQEAKKLINEGIEIARKKKHAGTVDEWKKELLRIAVLENDTEIVRQYTKHFAFDDGFDAIYYSQWKSSFEVAEWEIEIEKYINAKIKSIRQQYEANKGQVWYSPDTLLLDTLAPVYIEEKYWDRLLSLLSKEKDFARLIQYHQYLFKIYPLQLLAIYLPALELRGEKASNRREYVDLAVKMRFIMETIPEAQNEIIDVAEKLKVKYPRRPAMVEELNKIINIGK